MKNKPKKRAPSQDVKCEMCNAVVKARGLKTHLRNVHQAKVIETRQTMAISVSNTTDGGREVIEQVSFKRVYMPWELCYYCRQGGGSMKLYNIKQEMQPVCSDCHEKRFKKKK